MRKQRASGTAQMVAYQRALGNLMPAVPGFFDPVAEQLLQEKWKKKVGKVRAKLPTSPFPFWFRGMGIFNQFRTVVLDKAISSALPYEQLVILGAGLDGRAWRLPGLENTDIFEVDHPATQSLKTRMLTNSTTSSHSERVPMKSGRVEEYPSFSARGGSAFGRDSLRSLRMTEYPFPNTLKREQATLQRIKAKEIHFVGMDFTVDHLPTKLDEAGFKRNAKTFWLWEGVTMYLTPKEVAATLTSIAELSGPESRIAFTYMGKRDGKVQGSLFLRLMGEPIRSGFTKDEIAGLALESGWDLADDTGIEDWKQELNPNLNLTERKVGMQWYERIGIAVMQ